MPHNLPEAPPLGLLVRPLLFCYDFTTMLSSASQKKLIKYWKITAADSYTTMQLLYKGKRYADALFFGHLVLEKILKAIVAQHTKSPTPYLHNLIELWERGGLPRDANQRELLAQVNRFNVRARYPDDKFEFHKQCTPKFTKHYIQKIQALYQFLCEYLEKNKQ